MKNLLILLFTFSITGTFAQQPVIAVSDKGANPKIMPVLWQQTSAEYRALCYQAFNLATLRISEIPSKELKKGNLAIVTDLDETILDNSCREAQLIMDHRVHTSANWKEWSKLSSAGAVPGAVEFLNTCKEKGIQVFYISNRDTGEVESTVKNMAKLNMPYADAAHMLFLSNTSSKETRRQKVLEKYKIIMLMGDNLNDFTTAFEKSTIAVRRDEADKLKDEWGRKYIILPNSTYGEWENALFNYQRNLTPEQKDSILFRMLKGYK
jgi:5'-nucleotidase (lipoprotein e(P4) family)